MGNEDNQDIATVIEKIEVKLSNLEARRDEIAEEIAVQRAQIDELTNTIEKLERLEERLAENAAE